MKGLPVVTPVKRPFVEPEGPTPTKPKAKLQPRGKKVKRTTEPRETNKRRIKAKLAWEATSGSARDIAELQTRLEFDTMLRATSHWVVTPLSSNIWMQCAGILDGALQPFPFHVNENLQVRSNDASRKRTIDKTNASLAGMSEVVVPVGHNGIDMLVLKTS